MNFESQKSLLIVFFRSIFFIISISCLGLGIGLITAKIQAVQWITHAKFAPPSAQQLGNYYALSSTYAFLQGKEHKAIEQKVFSEFMLNLDSKELLKEFLLQNNYVKKYASDKKQLVEAILPEFLQAFQLNKASQEITFIWKNSDITKSLLSDYILYVSERSKSILNGELITQWKVLFQQVKFAAENDLGAVLQGSQIAQQDWKGKFKLMKAVQPLDDSLVPFRLQQAATLSPLYVNQSLWMKWGAFIGFLCAVGLLAFYPNGAFL